MWWFKTVLAGLAAVWLTACGFQPLYAGGKTGATATEFSSIRVAPIVDRIGQQLRNELFDLLTPYGQPAYPKFHLSVTLSESTSGLAVKKSEVATRANLRITANFRLTDSQTGQLVFDGSSSVVGSYNILSSDFSTLVAENSARDRVLKDVASNIQTRLSTYFRLRKKSSARTIVP